jgi:uncharacterized membrane protein YbhN (UPF0104 family)
VRYRLFTGWGVSASETVRAIAFSSATFWVGVVAVTGSALVLEPHSLSTILRLPAAVMPLLGATLLGALFVYVIGSKLFSAAFVLVVWHYHLPRPKLALAQLVVSTSDWLLASAVLYALLPEDIRLSILATTAAYVIAQVVAKISRVPGGIGVFEATLLILLSQHEATATLIAALVAYRIVYYLIPFSWRQQRCSRTKPVNVAKEFCRSRALPACGCPLRFPRHSPWRFSSPELSCSSQARCRADTAVWRGSIK